MTAEWDRAGIANDAGGVGRAVDLGSWWVPVTVRLAGGDLIGSTARRLRRPAPALLDHFLRLATGTDDDVLKFARKWGVVSDGELLAALVPGGEARWHVEAGGTPDEKRWRCVSAAFHRQLAGSLQALLDIVARLSSGENADVDATVPAWAVVLTNTGADRSSPARLGVLCREAHALARGRVANLAADGETVKLAPRRRLTMIRATTALVVTELTAAVGLHPAMTWGTTRQLSLVGRNQASPLAAIMLAFVAAATTTTGTAFCDGCGGLFVIDRMPRTGKRKFCGDCRDDGVPIKLAKRDQRARARAEET